MMFISYQEWAKEEEQRLLKRDPLVKCPTCRGTKRMDKRCCCCDNYTEGPCDNCEDGKVHFSELDAEQREEHVTMQHYEEAVLADAQLLAAWLSKDLGETLIAAGFRPWMAVWDHEHIHLIPSGE